MREVVGKYTTAQIMANYVEQIQLICDSNVVQATPDIRSGKAGPIGLTMTLSDKVMPMLLGNDTGCDVLCLEVKVKKGTEFQKLDTVVKEVYKK